MKALMMFQMQAPEIPPEVMLLQNEVGAVNMEQTAAIVGAVLLGVLAFAALIYLVTSIAMMLLLKNIGYPKPWHAWVPLLNQATLLQIAGIQNRWIWVLIPTSLSLVTQNMDGPLGVGVSLLGAVLAIFVAVWTAKGVQAGLGMNSVGGVFLYIFLGPVWMIWMALRSRKREYDADAAFDSGQTFLLNKVFNQRGKTA